MDATDAGVKDGKTIESKTKWAMLTSHCARRSICTNNYLMGTDALTIMAISGHKTEKSFRRYLKLGSGGFRQGSISELRSHLGHDFVNVCCWTSGDP